MSERLTTAVSDDKALLQFVKVTRAQGRREALEQMRQDQTEKQDKPKAGRDASKQGV